MNRWFVDIWKASSVPEGLINRIPGYHWLPFEQGARLCSMVEGQGSRSSFVVRALITLWCDPPPCGHGPECEKHHSRVLQLSALCLVTTVDRSTFQVRFSVR